MSIGLPSGVLSWFSVTLGVATGGAGAFLPAARALSVLDDEHERRKAERDRTSAGCAESWSNGRLLTRSKQW